MKTTFISTPAIANATRLSLMRMQNELAERNVELSTGRHADVGLELGHRTGRTVSLRAEFTRLGQFMDTNALVQSRLDTTQTVMSALADRSQAFIDTVISSRDGLNGPQIAAEGAGDALSFLISQLNTSVNGEFIFGGINTDVKPVDDYFASPAGTSKSAIDAAFLAEFGITQSDPAVANITAADMKSFLTGALADEFRPLPWSTNWSAASDQNLTSRISPDTLIESSVNANEDAFRRLAYAFTLMIDLGNENLNAEAFEAITEMSVRVASRAISDIALRQGDIGLKQQRIDRADQFMSLQLDILNKDIGNLEAVDPYETTTRINELISQIEVSYAVTGRLQQLSLVRYI